MWKYYENTEVDHLTHKYIPKQGPICYRLKEFYSGLSKGHKWIPGEILTHKHLPIVRFIIYLDEFLKFNPNIFETANSAHCEEF